MPAFRTFRHEAALITYTTKKKKVTHATVHFIHFKTGFWAGESDRLVEKSIRKEMRHNCHHHVTTKCTEDDIIR